MLKKILCILSLLIAIPAFAGVYEYAMANYQKVFLYLYTPSCGYCVKFNPIYNKVSIKYGSDCKFLKIDATSDYGRGLAQMFNVSSVPYVVLIDNNRKSVNRVNPACLLNYTCIDSAINRFVK